MGSERQTGERLSLSLPQSVASVQQQEMHMLNETSQPHKDIILRSKPKSLQSRPAGMQQTCIPERSLIKRRDSSKETYEFVYQLCVDSAGFMSARLDVGSILLGKHSG